MSQYATAEEFALFGLPTSATSDLAEADITALIEAASAVVDGVIQSRGYTTPLTSWDKDLSMAVCHIAAYTLLFHKRGVNPADPAHAAIAMSKQWADKHIEKVAAGMAKFANATPARQQQAVAGTFTFETADESGW